MAFVSILWMTSACTERDWKQVNTATHTLCVALDCIFTPKGPMQSNPQWGSLSNSRRRKGGHLLGFWFLEGALASDAGVDDALGQLQTLQDPIFLSQLTQDMFWTRMSLHLVNVANQGFDVVVVFWQDNWEFCLFLDERIR